MGLGSRPGGLRPTANPPADNAEGEQGARGKDALISDNWTNALTVVAVVAVQVGVARAEVQVVGVARARRVLRGRPVVAVRACAAETLFPAVARRWQEDAVAVRAREQSAVYTILRSPYMCGIIQQFINLALCRHLPVATPLHVGNVVFSAGDIRTKVAAG